MPRITLTDLAGGLTDSPFSADENCAEVAQNIFIQDDKDIETSWGMDLFDEDCFRVGTGARISKLTWLGDTLIGFSGKKLYKITPGAAPVEIAGSSGNSAFNLGDADSLVSVAHFNNHLIATNDARSYPIKVWKDGSNVIKLVTAGLPRVASDPTITGSGSSTHLYAFVLHYTYTVGTTTFEDFGPPRIIRKTSMADSVSITGIPVLSNGADYNYDTANIKVKIYRSTNNGTALYYVDEVTNGTVSKSVNITDSALILREPLYTSGGIQDNDPPPPSKWVWGANNTYYYGDIMDGASERPGRVIQSITSDPDSVPSSFFTPYSATVTGGGSVGRSNIVFTTDSTTRQDGILSEDGTGAVYQESLSNTIGCVAHNSIINTASGLYFASSDGFYFTNGNTVPVKLARKDNFASKIDAIYGALQEKGRIHGCYDKNGKRAFWCTQDSASDADTIFVYHETHDAFTTITNDSGILPTALVMDGDDLIIGDAHGYIFRMSKDYFTYPAKDIGVDPSTWGTDTIKYRWKSIAAGFGDATINKWITRINVQGQPVTNVDMACLSYTNGEPEYKELYPFSVSPAWEWGDPSFSWGDTSFVWDRTATMNQTRRFPAGRLRARHRAVEFTNAYVTIQSSTNQAASRITINAGAELATLVTPADYAFGVNFDGYDLVLSTGTYKILSSTVDTLTLDDPNGTLINGPYDYTIKGCPKGQRAHIMNFTLEYEMLTDVGTNVKGISA